MNLTVDPYDPDAFRREGHVVIDLLADYLASTATRSDPVLDYRPPAELLEAWPAAFPKDPL